MRELLRPDNPAKPDVNTVDKRRVPLLHHAVKVGNEDVLGLLLAETEAEDVAKQLRVNAKDRYGKTALDIPRPVVYELTQGLENNF